MLCDCECVLSVLTSCGPLFRPLGVLAEWQVSVACFWAAGWNRKDRTQCSPAFLRCSASSMWSIWRNMDSHLKFIPTFSQASRCRNIVINNKCRANGLRKHVKYLYGTSVLWNNCSRHRGSYCLWYDCALLNCLTISNFTQIYSNWDVWCELTSLFVVMNYMQGLCSLFIVWILQINVLNKY